MNEQIKKRISAINSGITPDGYKKTKVGIVPVEWEMIKLNNISRHITEKNKDMKYNETYTNSATQGIIKQTDYFDKQISNADNIDGYYIVRQNDYVYNPRISVSAPCGPISKSHFSETGIMSPLYTVFRLNDEYGNNDYIEHYFKSSFWYRYMSSVANYGVRHDRMNITNEDLFNMPIPFPPLPEQQKIAEILTTQDKLIELQERKIEQLKTLKKGYLQKMFPKKGCKYPELRFKGFTDDWEQRKLGDIVDKAVDNRGKTPPISENGTHPLIEVACLGNGSPDYSKVEKYLDDVTFETALRDYIKKGDILFSTVGSIGLVSLMDSAENAAIAQNIVAFRAKDDFDSGFLYAMFSTAENQDRAMRIVMGAVQPSIKVSQLINVEYFVTENIEEQRILGKYFLTLDALITLHQRKLDKEKQKKKALMQLLLTGKVRVST